MNKIEQLQNALNDATREVYEQFRKSGKCYDLSLNKEVVIGEVSEEYYNELLESDDDDVNDRLYNECPYCEDLLDSDYFGRGDTVCVGVTSDGEHTNATLFCQTSGDCWEMPIYRFLPDIASRVLDLMENQ